MQGWRKHSRISLSVASIFSVRTGMWKKSFSKQGINSLKLIELNGTLGKSRSISGSPVIIGNNAWVAMRSIIIKSIHIGDNSIIATGSITTKNVPSNSLFGGNPVAFTKKLEK